MSSRQRNKVVKILVEKIKAFGIVKNMTATLLVNTLFEDAQQLPAAYRSALAEKIVESIEVDIPESIENAHLEEIKRRQLEVDSVAVSFIDGDQVMHAVRTRLK